MPGPITALSVDLDRDTYSRLETYASRHLMVVRVTTTPADPDAGETATVTLRRRGSAARIIGTQTLTYDAATYTAGRTVTFDLTTLVDVDGLPLAIQDEYTVQVRNAASTVTAETARFPIMLISHDEFMDRWIYGLDLRAEDILRPVAPFVSMTGVTIVRVGPDTARGSYQLVYTASGSTLAWDGGTAVAVGTGNNRRRRTLVAGSRDGGWIEIEIVPPALPGGNVTETVILEWADWDWRDSWRIMQQTAKDAERAIGTLLEPEVIVTTDTDSAAETWDRIAEPVLLERTNVPTMGVRHNQEYLSIDMPFVHVQRIERLTGYINAAKALDVSADWYTLNRDIGLVEFVPSTGAVLTWQLTGQALLFFAIRHDSLPRFWHYRMVVGMREISADIVEAIGHMASIEALVRAGQGFKSGIASESLSRDGVSESRSYTSSAIYGVYSASIGAHEKWVRRNVPKLRMRYMGLVTVGRRS